MIFWRNAIIAFAVVKAVILVFVAATSTRLRDGLLWLLSHDWLDLFDTFAEIIDLRVIHYLVTLIGS